MLHHPDTQLPSLKAGDLQKKTDEFIKISEAWSVLSKPDMKQKYDLLRKNLLGLANKYGGNPNISVPVQTEISMGYNVQKLNYQKVQHNASSSWEDMRDKYKNEKWQQLPLAEKKLRRAKPVHSLSGGLMTIFVPILIIGGIMYSKSKK